MLIFLLGRMALELQRELDTIRAERKQLITQLAFWEINGTADQFPTVYTSTAFHAEFLHIWTDFIHEDRNAILEERNFRIDIRNINQLENGEI